MIYKIKRFFKHCLYPFQFLGMLLLCTFFKIFPFRIASAIGSFLARRVAPFLKQSRIARDNLRQAFPDMSKEEQDCHLNEMWDNLGRTIGEYLSVGSLDLWAPESPLEIVNPEIIDTLKNDGKPAILFLGHIGNWEYATLPALQKGLPITQLYRTLNNPYIAWIVKHVHATVDQDLDLVTKGSDGAKKMLRVLKEGGHLSMLIDQKLREGISVPFFGRDAMTPQAPAKLALKFQCPLVPVRVERLSGIKCRLTYYPPLELPTEGTLSERVYALTLTMNQTLEGWIRERPAQWIWMHNRWPKD